MYVGVWDQKRSDKNLKLTSEWFAHKTAHFVEIDTKTLFIDIVSESIPCNSNDSCGFIPFRILTNWNSMCGLNEVKKQSVSAGNWNAVFFFCIFELRVCTVLRLLVCFFTAVYWNVSENMRFYAIRLVESEVFCQYGFCHLTYWRETSPFNAHETNCLSFSFYVCATQIVAGACKINELHFIATSIQFG